MILIIFWWIFIVVINKLALDVSKTEYIIIRPHHNLNKIIEDLINSSVGTYLSTEFTPQKVLVLSLMRGYIGWENQIDSVTKEFSREIGAIRLIKPDVK